MPLSSVTVVTIVPSPYQVELFNLTAERAPFRLTAVYLDKELSDRPWGATSIEHRHLFATDQADPASISEAFLDADLTVFSNYSEAMSRSWMNRREREKKPWCFWGERPGYRRLGWVGDFYRRIRLSTLRRSRAPIWGIGEWAVDEYRRIFGSHRRYFNVPYFSDLSRFTVTRIESRRRPGKRLLYSGAFIPRKGVDLLAEAFRRAAEKDERLELDLLGDGPMLADLKRTLEPLGARVRFLGFQPWSRLHEIYAGADGLCIPSRHDGWALVVPEALASGLPVIASNRVGAGFDLIDDGVNGRIVPVENVDRLCDAILEFANRSPEERRRAGEAAVKSIERHQLADGVRRWISAATASYAHYRSPEILNVASEDDDAKRGRP